MKLKTTLIGSVAVSAVLAFGMAGSAAAKPAKHHHKAAAGPSETEVSLRSEVDTLKAEVQTLEHRLDAQAAGQAQTQAQIQSAQAQAQQAQAQAQAAQTQVAAQQSQIETIPAEVEAKTKKYEPLLKGWFNNTKVGMTVFADGSYIDNQNDGKKNSKSGVSYDIKRAYISIDHKFNDTFSANFTSDFTYDSTTKATQLYIKKAYLQANLLGDQFVVRAGSADLPWVPFVEGLYGYRYVDHVLIDNYSFGTSADWGVHVLGNLMDNHLGYALSVVNGNGYKIASTGTVNRTNDVDVEGRVNVNYDHFTVAVGGYDGKLGKDVVGTPTFHTAERFDVIGAYTDSRFRVGVEYLWAKYFSDVTQPVQAKTNTAEGVSAFGSWFFTPKFSIFGRYDWLKPQEDTNNSFHSNFYNVGLSYKPIGPLDFALVYKHDSVINGLLSTQNGTIGTLAANLKGSGDYDEVGIFTQVKF
jgi:nucleotide-binding universal stress UspA family protein